MFHRPSIPCLLFVVTAASSPAAFAEPSSNDAGTVDPVVITTATHAESATGVRAVTIIDRAQMKRSGARTVADAMRMQSSLSLTETHRGSGAQVQGLDAKHLLVLIDGVRVFGKSGEEIDLSRLDLSSVERIEVVKGAASSTYGADGLAGVINIITRGAKRPLELEVSAQAGSLTTTDLSMSAGGQVGEWSLMGSVGGQHRDAYSLRPGTPGTTSSAYDLLSTTLKAHGPLVGRAKLLLRANYGYRFTRGLDAKSLPKSWQGDVRWRLTDNRRSTHSVQVLARPEVLVPNVGRFRLSASVSHYDELLRQDQRGSTTYDSRSRTTETGVTTKLTYDHALGDHLIAAGLEGQFEWLATSRLKTGSVDRQRFGVFLEDEWLIADLEDDDSVGLSLKAGARLDVDTQFGTSVAPFVAVKFDPLAQVSVRASFGLGLRAPGFKELYLSFENLSVGYTVDGNPALVPERSQSLSASIAARPLEQLRVEAGYFRHDIDDLIVSVPMPAVIGSPTVYTYANVASATSQGLEASAHFTPWRHLTFRLSYTFTDARDDDTDRILSGRATHLGVVGLTFDHSGLSWTANARWSGQTPYDVVGDSGASAPLADRLILPPHVLVDVQVAYAMNRHLRFNAGITNLTDTGHPDVLPVAPRTIYAGLTGTY